MRCCLLAARHSLPYSDPMFRPKDLIVRTLDPFKDPTISTLLPFFFLGSPIPNQVVGKKGTLITKGLLGNLDKVPGSIG